MCHRVEVRGMPEYHLALLSFMRRESARFPCTDV